MQSKTLFLATALAALPVSAAFAQSAAAPPPEAEQAAPSASAPAAPAEPAAPAAASAEAAPTSAATQADLKAGVTVYDLVGATVGTIQSVTATGAVIASGKLRAEVPATSFAKNARGLVIGITKAEFEAAVNRAKS